MSQLNSVFDGVEYSDLIGGTAVTPLLYNASFTSDSTDTVAAGTVMTLADGVSAVAGSDDKGAAILATDVTPSAASEELVIPVFVRGEFNAEKLTGVDGQEDNLRSVGIYITHMKG